MDIFDNCRVCLRVINHEPIKMTRLIVKFLEKCMELTNIAKPSTEDNVKQNLCAACFNKISDFQDFYDQCKDSDQYWKGQFEDLNEINIEKEPTLVETVFFPVTEDNSLEADSTVPTTELKQLTYTFVRSKDEYESNSQQNEIEEKAQFVLKKASTLFDTSSQIIEERELTQSESVNDVDFVNWTDETNGDVKIQISAHYEFDVSPGNDSAEIIEYEYQIEKDEEISTIDENASSDEGGVDYHSFAYEKIEIEPSGKKAQIPENNKETSQNFISTTSLDENGKVKMSYKCTHCDKHFNRICDIESHCNIHSGIKPFTCNVCGKSFRQKNILTTHQTLHFGKKVECEQCGKKFARGSQLILHYRMHRDEKPFACSFDGCQAAFRQKKHLVDHLFIHTDEKNFQCATCSKLFQTRKRLQDHIYKVHSQHRYRCELCEKAFLKPHMLKHHMATAHNVRVDDVSHLKTLIELLKPSKKNSK